MKERTLKKIAKRYLDTGIIAGKYVIHHDQEWWKAGTWVTYIEPRSSKLRKAIYNEAYRRGWNGYWADSPLIQYIIEDVEDEETYDSALYSGYC